MESTNQLSFRANGKLLLTGEYAILDGAKSLCLPTKKGQTLVVENSTKNLLEWNAFLPNDEVWFKAFYDKDFGLLESTDSSIGQYLSFIFKGLKKINKSFFFRPLKISTFLEFKKDWGLGSSSTLISLLSQWTDTNPFALLDETFGGSGYDISCATASQPIFFQNREIFYSNFNPNFKNSIFFAYLNKKQNSRNSIKLYRKKDKKNELINQISELTTKISLAKDLQTFEQLIEKHENLLSSHLEIPRVQELLFADYTGGIVKSLGGWGGDFILITAKEKNLDYFREKNFTTIFNYSDLIL